MTQQQAGNALGLTTVHVNRTCQALRHDKVIETTPRMLTIRNWKALQQGDFRANYLHQGPRTKISAYQVLA